MLARAVRAVRSERWVRAAEMLGKAQDLIELLPACSHKAHACSLVEHIGMAGFLLELKHSFSTATEAA